ncbi:MAG: glycosyltransferase family 4 protein [bacterium]|nr:glycosyltransferase family 4 protein [bacterium]
MKILYLITKSNFGGAQRYVFDLATEAKKREHDVVVGFGGNGPLATKLTEAGVRTISIATLERDVNPLNDFKTFLKLLDLFAKERPEVIHLNSSKMGGLGALAARLWNAWGWMFKFWNKGGHPARIIFTGHGWAFNEERSDFERFLIGCAHWVTIRLAHQVIAVSRKTREQVGVLPFSWHKLTVIHNGVGPITTRPREEALSIILGDKKTAFLADAPIVVGTLAELHKNKGLSYAVEGITLLKKQTTTKVIFLILGEGEERSSIEAQIAKLGLEQTVFLAGNKENGVTLLSAFDIFLLPSITEAFPYAILEAGNAGLPIIATAVGGIPEVIDDMESGILIQSKNPGEVARALSYLTQNPDRRRQLGAAIAKRIADRFNLETMVEQTLALYKNT